MKSETRKREHWPAGLPDGGVPARWNSFKRKRWNCACGGECAGGGAICSATGDEHARARRCRKVVALLLLLLLLLMFPVFFLDASLLAVDEDGGETTVRGRSEGG